jgi:hypothetical protein
MQLKRREGKSAQDCDQETNEGDAKCPIQQLGQRIVNPNASNEDLRIG